MPGNSIANAPFAMLFHGRKSLHSIDQYKEYPSQAPEDYSLQFIWNKCLDTAHLPMHSEHRFLTLCSPLQLYSEAATLNKSLLGSIAFLILLNPHSVCSGMF